MKSCRITPTTGWILESPIIMRVTIHPNMKAGSTRILSHRWEPSHYANVGDLKSLPCHSGSISGKKESTVESSLPSDPLTTFAEDFPFIDDSFRFIYVIAWVRNRKQDENQSTAKFHSPILSVQNRACQIAVVSLYRNTRKGHVAECPQFSSLQRTSSMIFAHSNHVQRFIVQRLLQFHQLLQIYSKIWSWFSFSICV